MTLPATIPAILSAETTEAIAVANLHSIAELLHADLDAFLLGDSAPATISRLEALLWAGYDATTNVQRARDEVADLRDEHAHNLAMAQRAA